MAINKDFIIPDAGLQVNGSAVVSSSLGVNGAVTIANTLTVNGALTVANTIAVGNTTVTGNVNISVAANVGGAVRAGGLITGAAGADITGTANASVAINVGANVNLSVSAVNVGNSTSNTVVTQTSVNTGNTTLFTTIGQATGLFGNSTVNTAITSTSIRTGNASVFTSVNATALTTNGTLSVTGAATFSNNVTISGDFTVSGTTTFVNTATLNVSDNIIALNTDVTLAPSENAGVEVNRGTSSNVSLIWNETTDRWQISSNTSTFGNIHSTLVDVALGTDTSGAYVATITGGDGLTGSGSGEGSTPTLAVGAGNGITVTADAVAATAANGISVTAAGINVLAGAGLVANASGAHVVAGADGGLVSNATGVFVTAGSGLVANATGVHVGAANGISVLADAVTAVGANGISVTTAGINVVAGTELTSNSSGVHHNDITRTNTTAGNTSPNYAGTFTAIDSVTTNARGHVTGVNTKTVTMPSSNNTTYDLVAVANTAVNAGLLRLSDSSASNDTVTFTGTGAATVLSNTTHIIINANDTNETYVIKNIANTVANQARIQLLPTDGPASNTTAVFVGGGTTTVSANTTALLISSADQFTGTVTSVSGGAGLTGSFSTSGSLEVGAGSGITVGADTVSVTAGAGIASNATGVHVVAGTGVTSNATGVHIGQPVGTTSNVQFANVLITTAALGGTATNLVNTFTIQTNVGNQSYLRFYSYRHTTGPDWTSASSRIQQRIDTSDMAYIEFNPALNQYGIGIFGTGGKGLIVDTNGITTHSANVAMSNNHITSPTLQAYKEQVNATTISTSTQTLDLSLTNIYNLTLTSSTTLTFTNPPASGTAYTVTLYCKQDATGSRTIAWPAAVKWPNASVPTLSTGANKIDIFSFFTLDGGTTYVGALALANVG